MRRARAAFLGARSPADDRVLWAWDHPSATETVSGAAATLKAVADQNGVAERTAPSTTGAVDACWDLAFIAAPAADLSGVDRGDAAPGGPWASVGCREASLLNAGAAPRPLDAPSTRSDAAPPERAGAETP